MPRLDNLAIEILEDGTIKTTTDAVSGPNHANAEAFLKFIATLSGGTTTRVKRGDAQHAHTHTEHDHERQ